MSPLTVVATSLAAATPTSSLDGWDGQPNRNITPKEPIATPAPQPLRPYVPHWLTAPQDGPIFEPSSPEFDAKDPLTPLASHFEWPLEPTEQYLFGQGPSTYKSEDDYEGLQEFDLGLRVRAGTDDFTGFDELRF